MDLKTFHSLDIINFVFVLFFLRFSSINFKNIVFKFDEVKQYLVFIATTNFSYTLVYATLGNLPITQPFSVMIISRLAGKGY